MKKLLTIFITLFILSSCFNWNESNTRESLDKKTWLEVYSTWTFTVAVPTAWEKFSKNTDLVPKPIFGEVVLASVSKNEKLGFYNNFVVISQNIWTDVSSLDYSMINNALSAKDYLEYEELKQRDITFPNWKKSKLYVFKARYNEKSPKAVFIQAGEVCWNTWYLLTIWLNQSVSDTTKYEKIIETFTCKDEKQVEEK